MGYKRILRPSTSTYTVDYPNNNQKYEAEVTKQFQDFANHREAANHFLYTNKYCFWAPDFQEYDFDLASCASESINNGQLVEQSPKFDRLVIDSSPKVATKKMLQEAGRFAPDLGESLNFNAKIDASRENPHDFNDSGVPQLDFSKNHQMESPMSEDSNAATNESNVLRLQRRNSGHFVKSGPDSRNGVFKQERNLYLQDPMERSGRFMKHKATGTLDKNRPAGLGRQTDLLPVDLQPAIPEATISRAIEKPPFRSYFGYGTDGIHKKTFNLTASNNIAETSLMHANNRPSELYQGTKVVKGFRPHSRLYHETKLGHRRPKSAQLYNMNRVVETDPPVNRWVTTTKSHYSKPKKSVIDAKAKKRKLDNNMKLRSHSKKSNSQKSQSPKNSKSTSTDHENLLPLLAENLKNYRPPRKCRIKNHLASFDKFIESRNCANYPSINRGVQQTNFDRYLRRIRERLLLDGQMGPYQSLTALDLREHAERVSNGFNILTSLQVLTSKYLQEIGKAIKETESYQVKLEQLICFLEFSKQRKKLDNSKNYKNPTNDEAHKKAYEILSSFAENEPEYHKAWTKHSRKIVKLQNSLDKIMSTDSESLAIAYRYCNATTDIGAMISRAAALLHQRFVAAMDNRDGSMYVVPEKGSEEYKKRVRIIDENLEEQAEDENENCTICLTPLITTSKNVSTDDNDLEFTRICSLKRCSHKFHYECIQQWLIQRPNCPVCRKNLRQTNCKNNCRNTSLSSIATQTVRQTSNSHLQRISTGSQQTTNNRVRISGSYPHIQNENSNIQTTNTGRLIENHQNNMASLGRQIRSQIEMDPRVSTGEIPASDDLVIIENHMDRLIRGNNQEELFERRIDIGRRNGVI